MSRRDFNIPVYATTFHAGPARNIGKSGQVLARVGASIDWVNNNNLPSTFDPGPSATPAVIPFVPHNTDSSLGTRAYDRYYGDSLGVYNDFFTMSNVVYAYLPNNTGSLMGSNVMPSKYMPTSFLVPSIFWNASSNVESSSNARIQNVWKGYNDVLATEATMVSYQTNIYDAATWQISAALLKSKNGSTGYETTPNYYQAYGTNASIWADIDAYETMIKSGYVTSLLLNKSKFLDKTILGPTDNTPDHNVYPVNIKSDNLNSPQYQPAGIPVYVYPSPVSEPFRYRAIASSPFNALFDPRTAYTGKIQGPTGGPGWVDYLPVLGENAWAFFIGPLQALYIRKHGTGAPPAVSKITLYDKEVQMALSMLTTIEKMSVSIPLSVNGVTKPALAVLYAPGNSSDKNKAQSEISGYPASTGYDAADISNENNASLFAGLHILYATLTHMTTAGSDIDLINSYRSRVYALLTGIATYFRYLALCSRVLNGKTYYYFSQGGAFVNGQFYQNDDLALDCQTWPLLAFMSVSPMSQMNIDKWWQTAETINGNTRQTAVLAGFRSALQQGKNSYTIWYNSRQLFGTLLPVSPSPAPAGQTLSQSVAAQAQPVTATSSITGVGFTIKKFYSAGQPNVTVNLRDQTGSTVFTSQHDFESNTNVSGEWTAGAIFVADAIYQRYKIAQALADSVSMYAGLQKYVKNTLPPYSSSADFPNINSYAYSSERVAIPFGWNGNPIPSMASTSWMIMNGYGYNPFGYGGLLLWGGAE